MHCSRNRLEWDLSLEEAQRRKLEAYVKNSVSFMSRGEPIGKVWNTAIAVLVPLIAVGLLPGEFQACDVSFFVSLPDTH